MVKKAGMAAVSEIGCSYQVIIRGIFTNHKSRADSGAPNSKPAQVAGFLPSMCPEAVTWHH